MKSLMTTRFAAVASIVLALAAVNPASAANPLKSPRGLALAPNGNLYVANQSGNNIVVFNPNYVQLTNKTISTGISKPSGVAVDAVANVYVSNMGTGELTVYSALGVQNTNATVTGLNTPEGIALDGIDNIYIDEAFQDVKILSANSLPADSTPLPVLTYNPGQSVFSVATHNQFFAWGGISTATSQSIDGTIGSTNPYGTLAVANEALALAYDGTGNLYICNADNTVFYSNYVTDSTSEFLDLPFTCEGIVVDSARQRIYMSNEQGNSIAVYSTSGTLLTTIQ